MMNPRPFLIVIKIHLVLAPGLLLAACQNLPQDQPASNGTLQPAAQIETECREPRPAFCTFEYQPVCALKDTGIRCVTVPCDSTEWVTYGNGCSACGDEKVIGYKNGEC